MNRPNPTQTEQFGAVVRELERLIPDAGARLPDELTSSQVRDWLDKDAAPLDWACGYPNVTPDEWFFVTTLYGEMTAPAQRTHIRKFFPTLFVHNAKRDIRNFTTDTPGYTGLRSEWMKNRLCTM